MSTSLIPADVLSGGGAISVAVDRESLVRTFSSAKFLRRLELKSKGKLIDTGKVKPGHYAVIKSSDDADDLGESIDVLVLDARAKAIDMSEGQVIVSYDIGSDVFQDIQQRSGLKDSHCQAGASFLVAERSTGQLYEMFLGSESNQKETGVFVDALAITEEEIKAKNLKGKKPHGPLVLTLKSKHVISKKNKSWAWFVIVPTACSTPFTKDQIPDMDIIKEELEKFRNPKDGVKAEVEDKEDEKERAR
jgi:hypothetical protein